MSSIPHSEDACDADIGAPEQNILNYIKSYRHKYIVGYAFKWLSENGNLGGMSQEEFRLYIQDKVGVKTSAANISIAVKEASDLLTEPNYNHDKFKEYENMGEVFSSFIKRNQSLFTDCEESEEK